jgi:hypothetical protein
MEGDGGLTAFTHHGQGVPALAPAFVVGRELMHVVGAQSESAGKPLKSNHGRKIPIVGNQHGSIVVRNFIKNGQRQINIDVTLRSAVGVPRDLFELEDEAGALQARVERLILGHVADEVVRLGAVKAVPQVDAEPAEIERDAAFLETEVEILSVNERKIFGTLPWHAGDYSNWASL